METNTETNASLTWEDLYQHLLWWLHAIAGIFRFFWEVIFKYWRLSLSSILIFASLLVGALYLKSKSFEVTTTLVYGELHPKIFGDMIEKVNALLSFDQIEKAAGLLQLTPGQIEKIQYIEITDSQGKPLIKNYAFRKEPMVVNISLSAPIDEDSLQQAITFYLNSNPFTAERMELKKRLMQEEIDFLEFKLLTIDSVLTNLYADNKSRRTREGAVTIENSEGKNAYELLSISREMLQRKADIENQLANPNNVIAIDNFLVLPKARMSLGSIIKYGLVGIIVGYFVAAGMVFWRRHVLPALART